MSYSSNKIKTGITSAILALAPKRPILDYQSKFCPRYGKKAISRTYFAISTPNEPTDTKVRYFVELSYWLMSLSFEDLSAKPIDKNKYVTITVITIDCRKDR